MRTLKKKFLYDIKRPRKNKLLPEVLSREEVTMIIKLTENLKHKALLMIIYSGGLRLGETSRLELSHLDRDRAGIKKDVSVYDLRHYATHLLESGVDIRYIQELLGYASSKTTEVYTHASTRSLGKIRSPLDNPELEGGDSYKG